MDTVFEIGKRQDNTFGTIKETINKFDFELEDTEPKSGEIIEADKCPSPKNNIKRTEQFSIEDPENNSAFQNPIVSHVQEENK